MMDIPHSTFPHGTERVMTTGNTSNPTKALLLLHGRGASAEDIMSLVDKLSVPGEFLILTPQAAEHTWYPERFTVPKSENQPYFDSALDRIHSLVGFLETEYNIQTEKIILAGFSQGACLVCEYLKQYPEKYLGAAVFSGGLIGNDTEVAQAGQSNLHQTSVYIGCDVADFHIPQERVIATAKVLTAMGAVVDLKLYQGLGHSIDPEGLTTLQNFINS